MKKDESEVYDQEQDLILKDGQFTLTQPGGIEEGVLVTGTYTVKDGKLILNVGEKSVVYLKEANYYYVEGIQSMEHSEERIIWCKIGETPNGFTVYEP